MKEADAEEIEKWSDVVIFLYFYRPKKNIFDKNCLFIVLFCLSSLVMSFVLFFDISFLLQYFFVVDIS